MIDDDLNLTKPADADGYISLLSQVAPEVE
jgi:hypothetical protein